MCAGRSRNPNRTENSSFGSATCQPDSYLQNEVISHHRGRVAQARTAICNRVKNLQSGLENGGRAAREGDRDRVRRNIVSPNKGGWDRRTARLDDELRKCDAESWAQNDHGKDLVSDGWYRGKSRKGITRVVTSRQRVEWKVYRCSKEWICPGQKTS